MNETNENQNEKSPLNKTTQNSKILNENLHDAAAENLAEENKESAEGKTKKQKGIFHITAIVLIVLLVVAIVVQICVMINLKLRRDELNRRNDQLPVLPDDPEENSAATSATVSNLGTAQIILQNENLEIVL